MAMTLTEKIIANHSKFDSVEPGEIVDIEIDARAARDFGGPNVVKNMQKNGLTVKDPEKTFLTFDTNPTGSDQKYAANQQVCRLYARQTGIKVFDINVGIGTHTFMDKGLAWPGSTAVTTDSHANILGAIGAFGQGMGDKDIAAAWANGSVWFKVPKTVKINLNGKRPEGITAKDIVLNLLAKFGANTLLGYSVELYGAEVDKLTLDERITIASMATEMGAIILLLTPNQEVMDFCEFRTKSKLEIVVADVDAVYEKTYEIDLSEFVTRVALPGKPHDTVDILAAKGAKIDSAFVGSCTNGRMQDLRAVAAVLRNRIVAPGVVLKIVPSTDEIWKEAMDEGLIRIFKDAGALVSNAGCAGCAAGQVGQNGVGEITISTGNRNFPGKQGKGKVYLATPAVVAASAVAGFITTPDEIPDEPMLFEIGDTEIEIKVEEKVPIFTATSIKGRVWVIDEDNIDTDMIFHNRYLAITDINEMGQYTFDNLEGHEIFAEHAKEGDIVIVGKNFGSGSSRQQAVDCFKSLGVQAILAKSFGAIYERNAINAAFPIVSFESLEKLEIKSGDNITVNFETGEIVSLYNNEKVLAEPFSEVQLEIYKNGGLF